MSCEYLEVCRKHHFQNCACQHSQPPAPDIAGLLRDVARYVDWIKTRGSGLSLRRHDSWHMNPNHDTILGAVCADCDAREWSWSLPNNAQARNKKRYLAMVIYGSALSGELVYGASDESATHAALLAFRDALRATAVCPECRGAKKIECDPGEFYTCSSCNGTSKAGEVAQ